MRASRRNGSSCSPRPRGLTRSVDTSRPAPTDVSEHESGPESPIAYGLQVPRGATQVGPLVRYRSKRLIEAYKPELDAAQAQRDAEQQRRRTEAEANGTPLPPPTPTPTTEPSDDTFNLLENPPKPDTTISLMRIDGSPTEAVRRMAGPDRHRAARRRHHPQRHHHLLRRPQPPHHRVPGEAEGTTAQRARPQDHARPSTRAT